jgi:hypothetical protein
MQAMTPEPSIHPINVAGAALLVQFLLLLILGVGIHLYQESPRPNIVGGKQDRRRGVLVPLMFLTFALLLFTEDFNALWSPLFPGVMLGTITTVLALFTAYVLNLLAIGYLIFHTGGASSSPFLSALFTVPALAIFLRMPAWAFIAMAVLAVLIYGFLLSVERRFSFVPKYESPSQTPVAFINVACLALAMLTGFVTRPVAITELPLSSGSHPLSASSPAASGASAR